MIRQVDLTATARRWTNVRCVVAGPTTKSATLIRVVTASGPHTVYSQGGNDNSLVLVASPENPGGGSHGTTVTTISTTVSVNGGTAPYTHSWSVGLIDGAASASALNPLSGTTQFRATGVSPDGGSAVFTDTVTDANGLTNQISVTALFYIYDWDLSHL